MLDLVRENRFCSINEEDGVSPVGLVVVVRMDHNTDYSLSS